MSFLKIKNANPTPIRKMNYKYFLQFQLISLIVLCNPIFAQYNNNIDTLNTQLQQLERQRIELKLSTPTSFDTSKVIILYRLS